MSDQETIEDDIGSRFLEDESEDEIRPPTPIPLTQPPPEAELLLPPAAAPLPAALALPLPAAVALPAPLPAAVVTKNSIRPQNIIVG